MHKDLIIKFDDYDTDKSRNYALNNPTYAKDITATYGYGHWFDNFYIDPSKSNSYNYMVVSMRVKLSNYTGDAPAPNLRFTIGKQTAQLPNAFTPKITTVDEWITVSCINSLSSMIGIDRLYIMDSIFNNGTMTAHVEIKDIKVEYTNDSNGTYTAYTSYGISADEEYSDITNDSLLEESFSLNESLCSRDDLQFGACEASYIEFECCNKNGKYKKKNISAFTNIAQENVCHGLNLSIFNPKYQGHSELHNTTGIIWGINYGEDIRKIPAELISQYQYIIVSYYIRCTAMTSTNPITAKMGFSTMDNLAYFDDTRLYSFTADLQWVRYVGVIEVSSVTMKYLDRIYLTFGTDIADISVDYKQAMLELSNTGIPSDYAESYIFNGGDYEYLLQGKYQVPLGKYHVTSVQKTSNKGTKRIQAYDNSTLLDVNAEDWYSAYMFGRDFNSYVSDGLQFARTIYSCYHNITKYLGIVSDTNVIKTVVATYNQANIAGTLTSEYFKWLYGQETYSIRYSKFTINSIDANYIYSLTCTYDNSDIQNYEIILKESDVFGRGYDGHGDILIIPKNLSGVVLQGIVLDSNDFIQFNKDVTSIDVYIPYDLYCIGTSSSYCNLALSLTVYKTSEKAELKNGDTRLMYYNYGTKDIFNAPGGITARRVVQSLLEVCGCFFMINRYGIPSFIYCVKSSLYPSETLYPDIDLFPRGTGETTDKSLYKEYEFEDYEVKDIGRIQIKKLASDNVTPICEWEYVGDANKENTYIISDNVFYCSTEMEYDYDNMPEVSTLLTNMFSMISNIGFIPHDTKAVGLPYVEVGDRIKLVETDGSIETFIFSRYLKGIQSLEDNYEATGREKTQAISNYGYSIWEG